jgi:hypothetical protein
MEEKPLWPLRIEVNSLYLKMLSRVMEPLPQGLTSLVATSSFSYIASSPVIYMDGKVKGHCCLRDVTSLCLPWFSAVLATVRHIQIPWQRQGLWQ